MGEDGRTLVTRTSFRFLQTLYNLGPAPEPNLTVLWSDRAARGVQALLRAGLDRHVGDPVRVRRPDPRASAATTRAIACCVSAMRVGKQMQFFGARVNLAKTLLYAINGGRDEISGEQVAPPHGAGVGRRARLRRRRAPLRHAAGLAGRDLRRRAQLHPLHARQVRLRAPGDGAARPRRAAHDGVRHRGPVGRGRLAVGDQVRQGQAGARRARARRRLRHRGRRSRPTATTTTGPTPSRSTLVREMHAQPAPAADLPRRGAARSRC